MQFYMQILFIDFVRCSKFGCNNLTNKENRPIVCMIAVRYIGTIWLVPIYIQRTAIRNICIKFHQARYQTERLVCVPTHGHTDKRTPRQTDRASSIPLSLKLLCKLPNILVYKNLCKLFNVVCDFSLLLPSFRKFLSLIIIIL